MARILFLDDDECRHSLFRSSSTEHEVVHVYTAEAAEGVIGDSMDMTASDFDFIFLDHDLEEDHYRHMNSKNNKGTGFDVVDYLTACRTMFDGPLPVVVVHSWNVVRGPLMVEELIKSGYQAYRWTFGYPLLEAVKDKTGIFNK